MYRYPVPSGSSTNDFILERAREYLRPHLPASLSLYRRLQFGRFLPATRLISSFDLEETTTELSPGGPAPWLIAFVDRSCRPETELWMFGSWESEAHDYDNDGDDDDDSDEGDNGGYEGRPKIDKLVAFFIETLRSLKVPASFHDHIFDENKTNGESIRLSDNPLIMLWGAVHVKTMRILQSLQFVRPDFDARAESNYTFIWNVDDLSLATTTTTTTTNHQQTLADQQPTKHTNDELPPGLVWGQLDQEHLALVRSRTRIARQDKTLAVLPHLAIFDQQQNLIAWVFAGLDASLTSLHVEEPFRRQGLAQKLTKKLFTEKMDMFWEQGVPRWALGYVGVDNEASRRMCESIGGREGAQAYWLRMDLGPRRGN